jgi:signal transduction histidine kinase
MVRSLRVRFLITLIGVVTVAVGTVAFFASRATTSEFRRSLQGILNYPTFSIEAKIAAINKALVTEASDRSIWEDLQTLLEGMGRTSKARFVMADIAGNVLADSTGSLIDQQINTDQSKPFAAFLIEGKPVLAYLVPLEDYGVEAIQARFTNSVNRSLLIAIISGGLVALGLTLLLSRSILRPVSALISAARAMEKGDLSQRVAVTSRDEIGELAQAFNAMADGLERLEDLRRNMVTDIAHELRTPLSNIRGYLEAVQDGVVEPSSQMIASLHEEAMLLSRLVDDLQELALAEAGMLTLARQPIHLQDVVNKAVLMVESQANAKGLAIEVRLPADLPMVDADAERMSQVVRNLLNNAVTNTPSGGKILISAQQVDSQVEVSVQDTGIGIEAEHLPFVFERFYRADQSRARRTGGAGLGLAIVKQLVEAQGGQVCIASQPGLGTTVTFTSPIANGAYT